MQRIYNPIKFEFSFNDENLYTWHSKNAHKIARQQRDADAKEWKRRGYRVKKFSLQNQLVKAGGIGSGNPEINEIVTCYGFNVLDRVSEL